MQMFTEKTAVFITGNDIDGKINTAFVNAWIKHVNDEADWQKTMTFPFTVDLIIDSIPSLEKTNTLLCCLATTRARNIRVLATYGNFESFVQTYDNDEWMSYINTNSLVFLDAINPKYVEFFSEMSQYQGWFEITLHDCMIIPIFEHPLYMSKKEES